jgi:H/ACA ribonucleoprotein complex subunit 2
MAKRKGSESAASSSNSSKKKSKPTKNEEEEKSASEDESPRELYVSPLAKPLATEKETRRILRVVKKVAKEKALRRGVKEVVKALRKQEKGICIIAGDIYPMDVIAHVPVLCEENGLYRRWSALRYAFLRSVSFFFLCF